METPERKPEEAQKEKQEEVEPEEGEKYDGGEIPRAEPPPEK